MPACFASSPQPTVPSAMSSTSTRRGPRDGVIFGARLRRDRRRPRRLRPAPAPDRRAGPPGPGRPRRPLSRLARAPRLRLRPRGDARRPDRALAARGRPGPARDGALPAARSAARRAAARAARSASPRAGSRPPATVRRRSSPPAKRPVRRSRSAAGWGSATPASASCGAAACATCAPARSTAARERWSELASTPPRGRSRSHFDNREGFDDRYHRALAEPAEPALARADRGAGPRVRRDPRPRPRRPRRRATAATSRA